MFTTPKLTPAAVACGPDGMALLGRTVHDLRGFRYSDAGNTGPAGAAAAAAAAPAAPAAPAATTETAPPATTAAAPAAPATTTPTTAAPAAPGSVGDSTDGITAPVGDVKFEDLPAATQAEVRRLRQADQAAREQRRTLGLALGYEKETPSPDQLTTQVGELTTRATAAESRAQAAERANIVLLEAPDAGGNANLLLDSRGFTESIAGLDPTDRAAIQTAIKTWVAAHPEHAGQASIRGQLPGSSTGRQAGATGTPRKPGLEGAIADQMKAAGQ